MKKYLFLFNLLLGTQVLLAQSISMEPGGLTIRKSGIGLDISNGSTRFGTAIVGSKAIFQTHSDHELILRTNNNADNSLFIYNNIVAIGPLTVFSPESFSINKGRLKFSGSKDINNASGTEFTNAAGTLLRGFLGMADDGTHLGWWGYGNNKFNVRLGTANGFMGIGAINPATRLHVNGNMKVLGLGHPLTQQFLAADQYGVLQARTITDIYTISSADFVYRTGSNSQQADNPYGLYYSIASSGTPVFLSHFSIPNGVTLESVNLGFIDNSTPNHLEACLIKVNISTSVQTDVLCTTTASNANSASVVTTTTSFPANTYIDNNNFQYFFRLRVLNGATLSAWPANTIEFKRANFTYKYLNY